MGGRLGLPAAGAGAGGIVAASPPAETALGVCAAAAAAAPAAAPAACLAAGWRGGLATPPLVRRAFGCAGLPATFAMRLLLLLEPEVLRLLPAILLLLCS